MRDRILARRELLVLLAILALAALLRLPGLDQRGRWDADQGHDMLVLRALVTRGEVPLLGPPTSIGTFHHGALYYYLLAPSALVSNADPVAVTGEIALVGIAAVGATWWLARLAGGPSAALVAGLLAAVSPAGIDESTFIWNPNLIPLASALAFGAAIRAWQTRRPRWWLVAAAGAMVTAQLHVLGIVLLPPLAIVWLADLRRRTRTPVDPARPLVLAGLCSLAILAAGYLPLVAHEIGHDFSETRAILDYVLGGGRSSDVGLVGRLLMVALRSITWPLTGLVTDRPAAALGAGAIAVALAGIAVLPRVGGRPFARWLAVTFVWSVVALAIFAPSLAVVTPGLPNDHYHAFLDPLVAALCGLGLAQLAGGIRGATARPSMAPVSTAGPVARSTDGAPAGWTEPDERAAPAMTPAGLGAAAVLVVLVGLAVLASPPATAEDGGWRLADAAAVRVIGAVDGARAVSLVGIPPFKSADALRFPLERRGLVPLSAGPGDGSAIAVVVCDPLFDEVVGRPCGGPAEEAWQTTAVPRFQLDLRFVAGPRRIVSVYGPRPP